MTGLETGTLMAISAGMSVVSTAVTAIGQIQQGNAQKSAANYNAAVARNNAILARQNAAAQAKRQERESRIRAGANRAAVGASGIDLMGSALDIMEDNAMEEELDRLTILHQGEVKALGLESGATLEQFEGRQAARAGKMGAAGTLLKGGAKLASGFSPSSGGGVGAQTSPTGFTTDVFTSRGFSGDAFIK